MPKTSGLGDNFYVNGYDLSGDVASLDTVSGPLALLVSTAINQKGTARLPGLRDGAISFTSYFESTPAITTPGVPGSGTPVTNTSGFPVKVTVIGGTGTNVTINGVAQGSFDGTYNVPIGGTIALTYTVAPTWNWFALGTVQNAISSMPSADQVVMYMQGSAIGNPAACMVSKESNYAPTRDNTGNLTLKADYVSNAFGVEWGKQLTAGLRTDNGPTTGAFFDLGAGSVLGCQAYLELIELVGTSIDVTITHCTTSGGTYTSLLDFGSQNAIGGFRQATSNTTTVNEFVKVVSAGSFTQATFGVVFVQNIVAGQVF